MIPVRRPNCGTVREKPPPQRSILRYAPHTAHPPRRAPARPRRTRTRRRPEESCMAESDIARRKTGITTFTASEARDAMVKKSLEAERNAFEVKTAKLRALRLAKEAADTELAVKLAAEAPVKTAAKKKPVKAR